MTAVVALDSATETGTPPARVVYLLGAGATQGCAAAAGTAHSLLMSGIVDQLRREMREFVAERYAGHVGIERLVNEVVEETTDFEQLLTFLEDAPTDSYRELARGLKEIFARVLRERLRVVEGELGGRHSQLYATLIDMHLVPGLPERLKGFLTLNYDEFLDHAIHNVHGLGVDDGISIGNGRSGADPIRVLKLHGSFGWASGWPVQLSTTPPSLWIPPGIRKQKGEYPFNLIWGLARELLDCDILRMIGCNLGSNDWDLVSLLFTTMHTHASSRPYRVEVIGRPQNAERIAKAFPYLEVQSILKLEDIGASVVTEHLGGSGKGIFRELTEEDQQRVVEAANVSIRNPFAYWLRLRGEYFMADYELDTALNLFRDLVAS